jgi:transcriptional regulator with XRE-family HTH domain
MNGRDLRTARIGAAITGEILCKKAGVSRTRLSEIERGYREATSEEKRQLTTALQDLIAAKERMDAFAAELGWPVGMPG